MKGAFLLAVILAGLVAVQCSWERNKEYKYDIRAKALKFFFQSQNEPTTLYYRLHLTLRPHSDNVIIGQISEAKFVKDDNTQANSESGERSYKNSPLNNDDKSDSDYYKEFENSPLSKPFKINLRNDVIQSLGVDESLSDFEVNQLKLIMSQFQVDTTGQNEIQRRAKSSEESQSFEERKMTYKTADSGRCETNYEISPIASYLLRSNPEWVPMPRLNENNGEVFEIIKTKDSANCGDVRENEMSIVERQRIVASGSMQRFTIQSALTEIATRRKDTPLITVYMNTTLESVKLAPRDLPSNLKIVENLTYGFNTIMEEHKMEEAALEEAALEEARRVPPRFGDELRFTKTCWTWFMWPNNACMTDFGTEWKYTGIARNCGFLGLGVNYQCKKNCKY